MTTTMEHDWRDVLMKAASIVEEGWCQGELHIRNGHPCGSGQADRSCATGAITRAVNQMMKVSDAVALCRSARYALMNHLGRRKGSSIVMWNDHPDRTAIEVADAMREAAAEEGDA